MLGRRLSFRLACAAAALVAVTGVAVSGTAGAETVLKVALPVVSNTAVSALASLSLTVCPVALTVLKSLLGLFKVMLARLAPLLAFKLVTPLAVKSKVIRPLITRPVHSMPRGVPLAFPATAIGAS